MLKNIKRVLIANRGEIAVRIIRTLRELEVESVAVYSDADEHSLHRKLADYSIRLPGKSSAETYLNQDLILDAILQSKADSVHPGYGFLSENANFAQMLEKNQIRFIGPSSQAMEKMGNKVAAKALMKENNVPTVPGSNGALKSIEELRELVSEIGLPIMLKAAAGGGGRGMREIHQLSQIDESYHSCIREAKAYFNDETIFAEKLITKPRHIEIQILADGNNAVHFFERDCSIQRRHQKLIEEAPSLFLNDESRERLGTIAVKAAEAVNYCGVGTVEFICQSPTETYFMEMNTRIQVEHPVTEMITGVDLIKEQILVADGNSIRWKQEDIQFHGWSIEARINAEDPAADFMPSQGQIEKLHLPSGPFVRVDTHIYDGYHIPSEYDSMIAKVIVWGKDRNEALTRLRRSLCELELIGITTTAQFHEAISAHEKFIDGDFDTGFMESFLGQLKKEMTEKHEHNFEDVGVVAAYLAKKDAQNHCLSLMDHRPMWNQKGITEAQKKS